MHVFPTSVIDSMARGDVLQIVAFSVLFALAVIWGVTVVADSALFSALVAEHSSRDYVGTALTVQLCAGFLLTMVSIRLIPFMASVIGWQWAFLVLVPGPALGTVAMSRLTRETVFE